jgi:hypothetical protein
VLEELNLGIGKVPATDTIWWRGNKKKGISRLTSRFTDNQSGERVESSGARIIAVSSIISEFRWLGGRMAVGESTPRSRSRC